jgi:hypothetical protein
LAAIGQASQCEHDTRNRPGSSIPISIGLRVLPPPSMINPSESFRCPGTAGDLGLAFPPPQASGSQRAPLRVQEVEQVTVVP